MSETPTSSAQPSLPKTPRSYRPWLWPAYRRLLQHSKLPILVGPWRDEFGIEALYWIPWLNQLRADLKIDPERMIPISSGGGAALYGVPLGLELYAMRTAQEVRIENRIQRQRAGVMKQTQVTDFDTAILKDAAQTMDLKRYLTIHPAWMHQTLRPYFLGRAGMTWLQQRALYQTFPVPDLPDGCVLPDQFVCARFYFRHTFPHTEQTIQLARAVLHQVAAAQPVVLLNSDLHVDEHADYTPTDIPNVLHLKDLTPIHLETNKALMAAVMARSMGFVGTYGGLGQLATFYQKPAVTFYTAFQGASIMHKNLSDSMAILMGVPFHALKVGEIGLLSQVLPHVQVTA